MAIYGTMVNSDASGAFGFRNRLINGNFDIWQRGTSLSGSTGYLADRWYCSNGNSFARNTDVPNTLSKYSIAVGAANNGYGTIDQYIESVNCKGLDGQVTVSFWAKSTGGSAPMLMYWQSLNSADVIANTTTIAYKDFGVPSTSWTKYTWTFTSNSTAATNGVRFFVFRDAVGTNTTLYSQFQVEAGAVATPFEVRPIGLELALCQRYYEISNGDGSLWSGSAGGASNGWSEGRITFMVQKRVTPTMTIGYSTIGDNNVNWDSTGSANQTISSAVGTTSLTFSKVTKTSGLSYVPYQIVLKWAASSELS